MRRLGVITGTGMKSLLEPSSLAEAGHGTWVKTEVEVDTQWGTVPLCVLEGPGGVLVTLHRHHGPNGLTTPPHSIKHRAHIQALKSAGVEGIFSTYSVGTLTGEAPPGSVILPTQILNMTGRVWTFHDDDAHHADLTHPFSPSMIDRVHSLLESEQPHVRVHGHVLATTNGPQFESPAEVNALEILQATLVGMTASPEVCLAAEAELPILGVCLSSNWAAGRHPSGSEQYIEHDAVEELATRMASLVLPSLLCLLSDG